MGGISPMSPHTLSIKALSRVTNVHLFRARRVLQRSMRIDETQRISRAGRSVGLCKPDVLICTSRLERGKVRLVTVATGHLSQTLSSVPSAIDPDTY